MMYKKPGSYDEDGVEFPSLYRGDSTHVKVTVHGTGYLNGWIDYNRDIDWGDADEHIFADKGKHPSTNWRLDKITKFRAF
ncbi:hypothetical protein JW935_28690 [candidate division KSB1 bacterium]|nr:hypothetical protein [candidate division KSB1 bacterium]